MHSADHVTVAQPRQDIQVSRLSQDRDMENHVLRRVEARHVSRRSVTARLSLCLRQRQHYSRSVINKQSSVETALIVATMYARIVTQKPKGAQRAYTFAKPERYSCIRKKLFLFRTETQIFQYTGNVRLFDFSFNVRTRSIR